MRLTNNLVFGPAAHPLVRCGPGLAPAPVFSHNDVYNAGPTPYQDCADPTGTNGNISVDPMVTSPGSSLNTHPLAVVDMGAIERPALPATGARSYPLTPARILDTRTGQALGPASTLSLQVVGQGGVPATVGKERGAQRHRDRAHRRWLAYRLARWPAPGLGVQRQLRRRPDRAQPGDGRRRERRPVDLYNAHGATHVVADVAGWFSA